MNCRIRAGLGPALSVLILAGCGGGDGLDRQGVSGNVTFDGKPVASGQISFTADDAAMTDPVNGGAVIKDGYYEVPADQGLVPGHYKVAISAAARTMDTSGAPGSGASLPKQMLPEKYNVQSTLTADVKDGGNDDMNFDLAP